MPYALDFTETAAEDIENLVLDLPESRREQAFDAIEAACVAFADRPQFKKRRYGTPSFTLHFRVGKVAYWWAATYRLSEDETTLCITHVFRRPL